MKLSEIAKMPEKKPDCHCDTGIISCSCEGYNQAIEEISKLPVNLPEECKRHYARGWWDGIEATKKATLPSVEDIERIVWKHCSPLYEKDVEGHTHTLKGDDLAIAIHDLLTKTNDNTHKDATEGRR